MILFVAAFLLLSVLSTIAIGVIRPSPIIDIKDKDVRRTLTVLMALLTMPVYTFLILVLFAANWWEDGRDWAEHQLYTDVASIWAQLKGAWNGRY